MGYFLLEVDGERECPLGDEAQIDLQEVLQASHHQSAPDEKDDRERDLRAHEQPCDPQARAVHPRAHATGSQRGRDGEPSGHRRRGQGHDEGGGQRGHEREGERAAVDVNVRESRDAGRAKGGDRAHGAHGERNSGEASGERKESGIEQLLKDDPGRAGAEGSANGQVGPSPDGLHQEKDGHVRAGEKQNACAADGERLRAWECWCQGSDRRRA